MTNFHPSACARRRQKKSCEEAETNVTKSRTEILILIRCSVRMKEGKAKKNWNRKRRQMVDNKFSHATSVLSSFPEASISWRIFFCVLATLPQQTLSIPLCKNSFPHSFERFCVAYKFEIQINSFFFRFTFNIFFCCCWILVLELQLESRNRQPGGEVQRRSLLDSRGAQQCWWSALWELPALVFTLDTSTDCEIILNSWCTCVCLARRKLCKFIRQRLWQYWNFKCRIRSSLKSARRANNSENERNKPKANEFENYTWNYI